MVDLVFVVFGRGGDDTLFWLLLLVLVLVLVLVLIGEVVIRFWEGEFAAGLLLFSLSTQDIGIFLTL